MLDLKKGKGSGFFGMGGREWCTGIEVVFDLLNVGKAEIKITQDNSDIACVVRVNKNDATWKVRQLDILANATVAIEKPDCELCYTVFTKEVYIGDTKFDKWTTKKQITPSIDVTNKNDVAVKILQYYK